MKALFVCDHRFSVHPDGRVFSGGRYPYSIWRRYLRVFDSLHVIGRSSLLPCTDNLRHLNPAFGPGVNFSFVPPINSVASRLMHAGQVRSILRAQMAEAEAVIIRLPSLYGELAGTLALDMNKPLAVELVGCAWDALWNHGSLRGRAYAPLSFYKTRQLVRRAPFILYVTERFLQRRYPSEAVTVTVSDVSLPSVCAISNVHLKSVPNAPRERGAPSDRLQIGLTGSYRTASKGIHFALKALAAVKDELPEFEFRVIGPGDREPYLKLANNLGLTQFKPQGELPGTDAVLDWLNNLDLYLQPSLQEGLPRALVEAMSQGLAALGSSAGGIPELLEPECLHKPGDWRTLSRHILKAATNSEWRRSQGAVNQRRSQAFRDEVLSLKRDAFWSNFRTFAGAHSAQT